jgi:fibronectin-binding autotransporter adhesin
MAITKIQAGALPADVITTAAIDDASITHAKLHTTMDLSGKTVTLPSAITDTITNKLPLAGGTVTGNVTVNSAGVGDNGLFVGPTGYTGSFVYKSSGDAEIAPRSGKDLIFADSTGGTGLVRIKSNGNVGIGTTSPGKKLDVNGEARITTGLTITPATSSAYGTDSTLSSYAVNNGVYLNGHGSGWLRLNGDGSNRASIDIYGASYNNYNDEIHFKTGNVGSRLVISNDGNVGIGTSSPQHDLVVQNDDGPIISLIGHNYSDSMGIVFNGGDQTNASTSGNTGAKIMSQLSISGGAVLGDLTFTTNSGDTFVDAMNIDTSGRVTTPSQPSFRATSGASNTVSAALVFTQKDFDVSNSYSTSTGRFTAPLAGTYLFYITALYTTGSTSPTWKVGWEKNGSFDAVVGEYQSTFNSTSSYHTIFNSTITMSLASGDYVNIKNMTNQGVHISGTQTKFGGYLLG